MADALAPLPTTEATSPTAEAVKRAKGLRALRTRVSLRRSFSTKHSSHSTPNLLETAPTHTEALGEDAASPKRAKSVRLDWLKAATKGGKKTGKKAKEEPVAVALDATPSSDSSADAAHPDLTAIPEDDPPVAAGGPHEPGDSGADVDSLAFKIQSLLLPGPPYLTAPAPAPAEGVADAAPSKTLSNARMFALLSDPEFMRGSLSSCQKSIWASLDNLRIATLKQNLKQSGTEELMVDDPESIMLYGPLQPGDESEIELARSQIVSVDANGTVVKIISDSALGASSSSEAPQTSVATPVKAQNWDWHWPFYHGDKPGASTPPTTVKKLVWLPSTTKLSLQVMWWGYRLYLAPSPVMAQLNSKEADAVKVASLITTALGWLVGHVPVSLIPLPLMPAFQLVKAIVPYIGYIGGFISWSWGEILSFDKGHGVTLTSTWLLPIALIPGTWQDADVPKDTTPATTAPKTAEPAPSTPAAPPPSSSDEPKSAPAPAPAPDPSPQTSAPTSPAPPVAEPPVFVSPESPERAPVSLPVPVDIPAIDAVEEFAVEAQPEPEVAVTEHPEPAVEEPDSITVEEPAAVEVEAVATEAAVEGVAAIEVEEEHQEAHQEAHSEIAGEIAK